MMANGRMFFAFLTNVCRDEVSNLNLRVAAPTRLVIFLITVLLTACGFSSEQLISADWPTHPEVTSSDRYTLEMEITATAPGSPPAQIAWTSTPAPASCIESPDYPVSESFEESMETWSVSIQSENAGKIDSSKAHALHGNTSALLIASSPADSAYIEVAFHDPASDHSWGERPGTWRWQKASIFLSSDIIGKLVNDEYLTLAGFWPKAGGAFGWYLRVHEGAELEVLGYTSDAKMVEFPIFAELPLDRWVDLEIGLHSQNGPGVKRSFAVILDGRFYGWFQQGHMADELYNRAGIGILSTTSQEPLEVFVDCWLEPSSSPDPWGPDYRPSSESYQKDFREVSGENWQIDWSTWGNHLILDPKEGLYSQEYRLQSGVNLDRMPVLTDGWAGIEIGWPQGIPPLVPEGYFGPMIAFRKEINREENLEIVPFGGGDGSVWWILEAWVGGGVLPLTYWVAPEASVGGSHIPEAGDLLQVRWEQTEAQAIHVQAHYYDASDEIWYHNMIDTIVDSLQGDVDFSDGYHLMSSITTDSPFYSIRNFTLGSLETYTE